MPLQDGSAAKGATEQFALGDACMAYQEAKRKEEEAKAQRLQAEEVLARLVGNKKPEGSESMAGCGFRVTVTNGITRTLDQEIVAEIIGDLPDEQSAVQQRYSLSMTGLKSMMEYHPEAVAILNRAITSKPKKAAIKVVEIFE
jgi:hypothetical protein